MIYDIGANVGYFSLLAAQQAGPGSRVHSFEPVPALVADLEAMMNVNGDNESVIGFNTLKAASREAHRFIMDFVPVGLDLDGGMHGLSAA